MPSSAQQSPHVLLVEDDRLILATLARGLRAAGFVVSEAASGEEAMGLVAEARPDIALLDMRLPSISGLEVARQLDADHDVPCLFLTAYGDPETVDQAVEHGALGYLVKPVDVAKVIPTLKAALVRAKELKALRSSSGQLLEALNRSRDISVALGVLMEHHQLGREAAFESLRAHARRHRRKLEEIAAEVVAASDLLNAVAGKRTNGN